MEEFKYLGTTIINQNSIQEEIPNRLKSRNACYYSARNPLSYRLLSRNWNIELYRTIIFPFFRERSTWYTLALFYNMWSDTKKKILILQLGNEEWEGREKQTAIEHVLTCHSVTRLSSIALLRTSGRIFKCRHVLNLSRKMTDCKSKQWFNIKFLVKMKISAPESFQLLTEAYGEHFVSRAFVFENHKRF